MRYLCESADNINVTHQDAFPLPRIDATLDNLGTARFFSTLDLQSGIGKFLLMSVIRKRLLL